MGLERRLRSVLPFLAPSSKAWKDDPRFRESDARVRDDEFIRWICHVTGGWLREDAGNLRALDFAIRHMPERGAVVEIGSFLGLSTAIISYLMVKNGRSEALFNCDPWVFEETEDPIGGFFDASRHDYRDYVKATFRSNMRVFAKDLLPHSFELFSDDFFRCWEQGVENQDLFGRSVKLGGEISFAYIDGAHSYEASRRDFLNVDRYLAPGGFVLFDDSADDCEFECRRTAKEVLEAHPDYELAFRTPNYLFRRRLQ